MWISFIPICCSKVAKEGKSCSRFLELQKVAQNVKSCSKVAEHNLFMPNLVRGGSDKRSPTLPNCYCCLTSPCSQEKYCQNICVCFILEGSTEPPEPPLDPPQHWFSFYIINWPCLFCC